MRHRLEVVLVAGLTIVASLAYAGFYADWSFVPAVAGAAAVPALIALVADRSRWPLPVTVALQVLAFPLFTVLVVFWDETNGGLPVWDAWSALGRGLVDGWARMLTVGLPADARGELLVLPVVVAWAASTVGALLALRTRAALAPLAPPAVAFVVALGFAAAGERPHLTITGGFLVVAVVLAVVRSDATAATELVDAAVADVPYGVGGHRASAPPRRYSGARLLAAAPIALGLAVVGTLLAGVLPVAGDDRFDPRELRHERLRIDDTLSPLVQLKPQLEAEDPDALFRLEVDGLPKGVDRIRTAALDLYDGAQWSAAGDYRLAGEALPPDPLATGRRPRRAQVRQRVTILGLDGPFLPVLGRPVELDAGEVGFDSQSGVLVSPRSQLRGVHYDVISDVGTLGVLDEASDLDGLKVPDAPIYDRLRTPPPEVPQQLQNLALQWARDSKTYTGELLAIRDRLRELRYDDSDDAPPGHSYGALLRMLVGEEAEREGYAEQLAAGYALLARLRGFPTRLAVGYRLPEPDSQGRYTITEAEAHAWPEVYLTGAGWVAIEPTDVTKIGKAPDRKDDPVEPEDTPDSVGPLQPADEPRVIVDDSSRAVGGVARVRRALAFGGLGLLAVLLLVPVLLVLAKRWRRRRRRRARGASARVMGAWHETLDRLTEHGLPVQRADTADEVSFHAAARFNGAATAVARMAPLVAVAVFAPFEPSDDVARHAWELEKAVRVGLRPVGGPRRRVRALFDPRPLVRRWGR